MTYEEYLEHLNNLDTFAKIFLFDSTKKSLNLIYQSIKNNKEFESAVSSLELLNACSYMLNDQVGFIDESQNNISKIIKKERKKMKDELKVKVNVVKLENENSKIKALATVIIGSKDLDCIKISNVRLYERDNNSYFVALPEKEYEKDGEKKYEDIIAPLSKELREAMTLACLESYKKNIIKSAEATEENTQSQENQEER